jgi:hypothetical protein
MHVGHGYTRSKRKAMFFLSTPKKPKKDPPIMPYPQTSLSLTTSTSNSLTTSNTLAP